jgi:hypothetical protein
MEATPTERCPLPGAAGTALPGIGRACLGGGGVERDVTFADAGRDAHAVIDAAYHAKYDRYGPQIVGSVVGDHVRNVTIRLEPRGQ